MRVLRILSLITMAISLSMCGDKDTSNNGVPLLKAWDKSSVSFSTTPISGTGENQSTLFNGFNSVKCKASSYFFQYAGGVLTKSVCDNPAQGYTDIRIQMTEAMVDEMADILSDVTFVKKGYDGFTCPLHSLPFPNEQNLNAPTLMQINQEDGSTKILDLTSEKECGEASPNFIHGTLDDFNFLNDLNTFFE